MKIVRAITGSKLLRGALVASLVAGIGTGIYYGRVLDAAAVQQIASAAGDVAPLLFVLGYALATVLFVPGSALTIGGGTLFGPVAGTFYSLTGATLGATLAFLAARYLVSDWVARRAGGRLADFVRGVESEGWRFVAFVRLVPLFPFNLLNYALGLTRIPLMHYVAASYLTMLPGAAAYTYLGYAGREALAGSENLIRTGLIALALLAVAVFLPRLARRLRRPPMVDTIDARAFRRRLERGAPPAILDVRGADEYRGELGHIPGALNIPLADLPQAFSQIEPLKEADIVVVCRTDKRSAKAADLLRGAGFRGIGVLQGGMEQWNRYGFPVARDVLSNPTGIHHGQDAGHP